MTTRVQFQDNEYVRNEEIRPSLGQQIAVFVLCCFTFLICGKALAVAPKLCLPNATGVAYQSGPPNWWDVGSPVDTTYNKELMITTDPRWRGALSVDYSQGGPTNAEFRGVYKATTRDLLLTWAVKGMNFSTNGTALVVGIKTIAGTPVVLRLSVKQGSTESNGTVQPKPPAETVNATTVTYIDFRNYALNNNQWMESGGVGGYNWAADATRIWIKPTAIASNAAWLVQMRIPLASLPGYSQGDTSVRLWYSMQSSVSLGGVNNGLVHYTWPKEASIDDPNTIENDTIAYTYYFSQNVHHIPSTAGWGEVGLGQQSGCAGIKLADSDIGVVNSQFPGQRSRISLMQQNIFYALPQNMSGAPMDMSNLTATFYFANWGSQVGTLVANQSWRPEPTLMTDLTQPPPATTWNVFAAPPNPPVVAGQTLGAGVAANNGIPTPAQVPDTMKAQLWRNWILSQVEQCRFFDPNNSSAFLAETEIGNSSYCDNVNTAPFTPRSVHPHGCMLVKLNGPGHVFLNDSAFRNMNFGTASVFEKDATISIAGLPKSSSGTRDVYLFVDKRNMPPYRPVKKFGKLTAPKIVITPEIREVNAMLRSPGKVTAIRTPLAKQLVQDDPVLSKAVLARKPMLARTIELDRRRSANVQTVLFDTLAAALPTYAMHAFSDLESIVYIDGYPHRLLAQQTSFGVYLLHDQNYFGWIEQMSPNALDVAQGVKKISIQDGKSALIRPRLEAVESIKPLSRYPNIELPVDRVLPGELVKPVPVDSISPGRPVIR